MELLLPLHDTDNPDGQERCMEILSLLRTDKYDIMTNITYYALGRKCNVECLHNMLHVSDVSLPGGQYHKKTEKLFSPHKFYGGGKIADWCSEGRFEN